MTLNALRGSASLGSEDPLVTEESLLARTGEADWSNRVGQGSVKTLARGVHLELLRGFVSKALEKHGISGAKVEIVFASDLGSSVEKATEALRALLVENEKSARDLLVANFHQGKLTGDSGSGHLSPVGAYDARSDRVLIFDVDREWYEPYWVSTEAFYRALATEAPESKKTRGLLRVSRAERK
jgi:hypothetical protein